MSVIVERQNYQHNLGNKIRQINEAEPSIAPIGTPSDDFDDNVENNSGITNHFQVPNLSSMLYQFTNTEQDRVNSCFRIGNFHSLRDLPKHLLPGNVSYMSSAKINENLYS